MWAEPRWSSSVSMDVRSLVASLPLVLAPPSCDRCPDLETEHCRPAAPFSAIPGAAPPLGCSRIPSCSRRSLFSSANRAWGPRRRPSAPSCCPHSSAAQLRWLSPRRCPLGSSCLGSIGTLCPAGTRSSQRPQAQGFLVLQARAGSTAIPHRPLGQGQQAVTTTGVRQAGSAHGPTHLLHPAHFWVCSRTLGTDPTSLGSLQKQPADPLRRAPSQHGRGWQALRAQPPWL